MDHFALIPMEGISFSASSSVFVQEIDGNCGSSALEQTADEMGPIK